MRIAIDARTISGRKTGDRTFTLGILRGLAEILPDSGDEVVAVLREADGATLAPAHPAFRTLVEPGLPGPLWMPFNFPRILERLEADVALLQYLGPFRAPCPFVTVVHDVVWRAMPETFPRRDRLILDRFLPGTLERAAAVVTVSEFSRQEIHRYFGTRLEKIHVVPNAVDRRFQPVTDPETIRAVREKHALPERFILNLGVIQPRKNVEGLILAYCGLPDELREQYGLVVTGKHGWGEGLPLALAETAVPGVIRPTGYVPDEDLPALYSAASAFVYPSLYEGFGIPPLEAMACGTPVLTSNVASLPEVVGDAALTVDPRDVDAIRQGLQRLLTDEELRARLVQAGLERAQRFTWRDSAEKLVKVLRRAVSG